MLLFEVQESIPASGATSRVSRVHKMLERLLEAIFRSRGRKELLTEVKLRGIGIMGKNIRRSINHRLLVLRKIRKKIRNKFLQILWIVSIDKCWVCEPSFVEIPSSLDSCCIGGGICERDLVASICFERDRSVDP